MEAEIQEVERCIDFVHKNRDKKVWTCMEAEIQDIFS